MRYLIILFLLITTPALAQRTKGCTKPLNEKYSFKDFTHMSFKDRPSSEFNNTCIKGSNFYQENKPDEDIFPDMTGVEFVRCNMDNVLIKPGNTIDGETQNRRIQAQNDLEDWILEKQGNRWVAKEPLDKVDFQELGLSIDPKDIPNIKRKTSITNEKKRNQQ